MLNLKLRSSAPISISSPTPQLSWLKHYLTPFLAPHVASITSLPFQVAASELWTLVSASEDETLGL
jgi:hypothetical protein